MTSSWIRPVLAVCLLVGLSRAPALADDAERAVEIGDEGTALYQDGEYAAAAEKFLEAYKLSPNAHNFIYNAGRAYHKLGKLTLAKQYYELALKKGSSDASWWGNAQEHLTTVKAKLAELEKEAPEEPKPPQESAPAKPDLTVSSTAPQDDTPPTAIDRDTPSKAKSRNWALIAAGGAAMVGALLFDVVPDGASDNEFSGWDLLPVVGYAAGAGLVWRGAF